MTRIDIIGGFLGAGKTTFIKKLLEEAFQKEKIVVIENEFGEISIDGPVLKDYGIQIREMNSGCICCTIAGDFNLALKEMLALYQPDRIIIEPSGVGKLSDVLRGCQSFVAAKKAELALCITVVDVKKYRVYIKNFAEFYKDQLAYAKTIVLSRTQFEKPEVLQAVMEDIRKYNQKASIVTTDWEHITADKIIESDGGITADSFWNQTAEHHHAHEHHHADEVFQVWGKETVQVFPLERLKNILEQLKAGKENIVRGKGIVKVNEEQWVQFDYVPDEIRIRETQADITGRICIIGEGLDKDRLKNLFHA